jgi:hypothetical protein
MELSKTVFQDAPRIFLNALEIPDYAQPEFFIKCQQESGWSKRVFLEALRGAYDFYKTKLDIATGKQRRQLEIAGQEVPDDLGIFLDQETSGWQKGKLTYATLESLHSAILFAYQLGEPQRKFDAYDVIAMCERMLLFIQDQFDRQLKETHSASLLADMHRKQGKVVIGIPRFIINTHVIITDAPVIDFTVFQKEVRQLSLSVRNMAKFSLMLKPMVETCVKIVTTWNDQLSRIEYPDEEDQKNSAIRDEQWISFEPDTLTISFLPDTDWRTYNRSRHVTVFNRDFAFFAARVGNFVAGYILEGKSTYRELSNLAIAKLVNSMLTKKNEK